MSESKRLNKRQARELQELEALGGAVVGSGSAAGKSDAIGEAPADGDENEEGELEADDTTPAPKASLFAQVNVKQFLSLPSSTLDEEKSES